MRSARETADEIRVNAEEAVARMLEEARAEAERKHGETEETVSARLEEATARAAELVGAAEARAAEIASSVEAEASEQRSRAEHEIEEIVESARRQGREMLDEAKSARERVLSDLLRRRTLLQSQIDSLRSGRDHLLDAYRVVKRTFLEATEALAQVEARVAADRAAPAAEGSVELETIDTTEAAEPVAAEGETAAAAELGSEHAVEGGAPAPAPAEVGSSSGDEAAERTDSSLADVDSLFARIRAGHTEATIDTDAASGAAVPDTPVAGVERVADAVVTVDQGNGARLVDLTDDDVAGLAVTPQAAKAWRARRAETIDPVLARLSKRAKRAAQDDQNALLDAVRRHKGRPTAAQVLVPEPELLAAWVAVMREAVDAAYGAGRVAAGGPSTAAGDALVEEAVAAIVLPLRERITVAIDAGVEGDTGGLVERIGARFREWKNQSLERALADELAMAWTRGVYDATPEGAVLHWIPLVEGRCADCDDNRLEPTVKGSAFPTGQLHPPAHPGCRCLLVPSEVLERLVANA